MVSVDSFHISNYDFSDFHIDDLIAQKSDVIPNPHPNTLIHDFVDTTATKSGLNFRTKIDVSRTLHESAKEQGAQQQKMDDQMDNLRHYMDNIHANNIAMQKEMRNHFKFDKK